MHCACMCTRSFGVYLTLVSKNHNNNGFCFWKKKKKKCRPSGLRDNTSASLELTIFPSSRFPFEFRYTSCRTRRCGTFLSSHSSTTTISFFMRPPLLKGRRYSRSSMCEIVTKPSAKKNPHLRPRFVLGTSTRFFLKKRAGFVNIKDIGGRESHVTSARRVVCRP